MNKLEIIGFQYIHTKDKDNLILDLLEIDAISRCQIKKVDKKKVKIRNSQNAIKRAFPLRHNDFEYYKRHIKYHTKIIRSLTS